MNSDGLNNQQTSFKYEMYASSGCRDIGIRKSGFVAKILSLFFLEELIDHFRLD